MQKALFCPPDCLKSVTHQSGLFSCFSCCVSFSTIFVCNLTVSFLVSLYIRLKYPTSSIHKEEKLLIWGTFLNPNVCENIDFYLFVPFLLTLVLILFLFCFY